MEDQHQQLRLFFTKFAGSVLGKADNELNIKCFTKRQIQSITDNYNNMLGKGGFSIVYKGRLDDGRPVAVKKYIFTANKKEFTKEVIIQFQFSHKNIVRLLGCCIEEDAPMLVTEFVPNGNLSDLLHGKSTSQQIPLSLYKRLKIATEVAEALVYMHTSQSHPILHGDMKPENILLDNKYMPKLSDFGISRLLSMGSDEYTGYVIGSMGYIDPMFCQTGCLTTKSDVYSFGVLLLELITRKKAIDDNKNFLVNSFGRSKTHDSFDKEIASSENIKVLDGIVKLALECLKFELEGRPEMKDVSECLWKLQREHRKEGSMKRLKPFLEQTGFTRFVTEEEIYKMTDHFNNFPTDCFMGKLYKGNMNLMPSVAIKMFIEVYDELMEEFSRQMVVQSKIDHENVIRFQGCWLDHGNVPILVYEFSETNLHDILFGDNCKSWIINSEDRLHIAVSIATGLDYLHSLGITHGDVRTSNILVGDNPQGVFSKNVPIKVSNIGASVYFSMKKAAHERFRTEENNGYMDPKFLQTGVSTKEADIYSMGVVLQELFTRKKVPNHIRNCGLNELRYVAVCRHLKNLAKVISKCLDPDARKRPTLESAIRLFNSDMVEIECDRLDALFCGDNCAARESQ